MTFPSFSIIINTLDRESKLKETLDSLKWLKYDGNFEVIVVNGPSQDGTADLLSKWETEIKIENCDKKNLSKSRNIGICSANGDIVVFIDDDAIPEPEWLSDLSKSYNDPQVGAAGGFVFNQTGYEYQKTFEILDRWGDGYGLDKATPHLSFPKSILVPHLLGCNCSFRKSALIEIGGFDEEYEYFLDETDVIFRIVDAGYLVAQLPNAFVHHKFAPSNMRNEKSVFRYRYPIIKNKIYFQIKHASDFFSEESILEKRNFLLQNQKEDIAHCFSNGLITKEDVDRFNIDYKNAERVGIKRGYEGTRDIDLINEEKIKIYERTFKKYKGIVKTNYKTIVLISRYYKPTSEGGIATFTNNLGESLALEGNIVHVITESHDINRVDFENGVWVHRILLNEKVRTSFAEKNKVPPNIWNWSACALEETKRICTHRKIDIVEAPIWDCEGIAFLEQKDWPILTSLHTTLKHWLDYYPLETHPMEWIENHLYPLINIERLMMLNCDGVRANSQAIISEIEKRYDFEFPKSKLILIPHGIGDLTSLNYDLTPKQTYISAQSEIIVLFVGRLESRKGIDTLLKAIPMILDIQTNMRFRIIGENEILNSSGSNYMKDFINNKNIKKYLNKVSFEGKVSEKELYEAYSNCDIFVAPSKFESFGLVFLEAMRFAKPVIGCDTGGIPEVVSDKVNGFIIETNNSNQLAESILALSSDNEMRTEMGKKSFEIFNNKFTSKIMACKSEEFYEDTINLFNNK